jgi:hypothetical protein
MEIGVKLDFRVYLTTGFPEMNGLKTMSLIPFLMSLQNIVHGRRALPTKRSRLVMNRRRLLIWDKNMSSLSRTVARNDMSPAYVIPIKLMRSNLNWSRSTKMARNRFL